LPESNLLPPLMVSPVKQPQPADDRPFVTVVSGLSRSGTSMIMQMLVAGGLPALTDQVRAADESNPRGYFELEKVKRLATDNSWLDEARGKVVKVVAPLAPFLPQACSYRVILLERDMDEVLASQARMLERLKRQGGDLSLPRLRQASTRQLKQANRALRAHQIPVLTIKYAEALADPQQTARRLADFLGLDLDRPAMRQAVVTSLYRERAKKG
jgi:hypothetical protein